ncbi:MAG: LysM peptidoglycan-binding domain-containing protein [Myxococcota bacterium]
MRRALAAALGVWVFAFAAGAQAERVHVVQPGETLWQISERWAGDADRWPELYRANRDQIKDPSLLYPGQRLAIPYAETAHEAGETTPPVSSPPEP